VRLVEDVSQHRFNEDSPSICIILHLVFQDLLESMVVLADNVEILEAKHFQD